MKQSKFPYRLSEIESNQGILFSHEGASPGCHCPMHTALSAIRNIEGLSSLVVGMPECSFYSRYVMDTPIGPNKELHYTYVLDSNEVVFGCRDGLTKALEEMERDNAKAIVVIMTCIPALIGEDIAEIAEAFCEEHVTKAVCIDLAHYKRNGYEAGFYESYQALLSFCVKQNRIDNQVAFLGSCSGEEGNFLKLSLKNNAFEILEINAFFSIAEFQRVTASRLTIVTQIHFLPLAKRLEQEYHIPYIFLAGAYSIKAINKCYQQIQEQLTLSEAFDFTSFNSLLQKENEIRKKFKNSRFVITAVVEDVLLLTEYLCSLSMKPCLLHLEEYRVFMREWKEKILAYSVNPLITYMVQDEPEAKLLKEADFLSTKEDIRLCIGNRFDEDVVCIKTGRFQVPFIGYERTLTLLTQMENAYKEEAYATI
ncbi:nitrogenase component 1 [Lachnotalea glycerini]|uniref:Nitrogenase/oxidoreductase component 1 domain-containing protein n=1 Tax=Lachnotalea glycerini TaxID=1763509 RepID=A0A371JKF1_9FIRM|nr:nitrogenase component 1 [Lachnotalea glycerini]RDY33206.1 hypothetical protein CG710_001390 [Lachnotalea glycerini]